MAAYNTRALTPSVYEHLKRSVGEMPKGSRPNFYGAALVLSHLARWSQKGGTVDKAVSQIANELAMPERQVRYSLDALETAGIALRLTRGGGRRGGGPRTGAMRLLALDYHENGTLCTVDEAPRGADAPTVQTVNETDENTDRPEGQRCDRNTDRESVNSDREGSYYCPSGRSAPTTIHKSSSSDAEHVEKLDGSKIEALLNKGKEEGRNERDGIAFVTFFARYPKKSDRAAAEAAWDQLDKAERFAAFDAIDAHRRDWQRRHGSSTQYVPSAARWITERRWLTPIEPTTVAVDGANISQDAL